MIEYKVVALIPVAFAILRTFISGYEKYRELVKRNIE